MSITEIKNHFKGRDFISLKDYSREEINYLIETAITLKTKQKQGTPQHYLSGKTLGMIFQKSSTRTRVSFEVGMYQLGGMALFLSSNDLQIGRGEPVKDTARVLSRYLDGIMIRTFSHDEVLELAYYADIPIINGLTDLLHPCQALADIMTIKEQKGDLAGLKMAYIGDGNNMAQSLMFAGAKMGMEVVVASPIGYRPQDFIIEQSKEVAKENGGSVIITKNIFEAASGADVLYTDVWASMGQEQEAQARAKAFAGYQINEELLKKADPKAIVLHCLPAHRGEEITDEVMEGLHSAIYEQAENRLHAQKAIMALLMS